MIVKIRARHGGMVFHDASELSDGRYALGCGHISRRAKPSDLRDKPTCDACRDKREANNLLDIRRVREMFGERSTITMARERL